MALASMRHFIAHSKRPTHPLMIAFAAIDDESQPFVKPSCGRVVLLHMQVHSAAECLCFALRGFDQRAADGLPTKCRKQADIDQQVFGRSALEVIATNWAMFDVFDRQKVAVAEMH